MRWCQNWVPWILGVTVVGWAATARGEEGAERGPITRQLRPEIELLMQPVAERLQAAADALKLSPDQLTKMKGVLEAFSGQRKALRDQRRALLESDLRAIGELLTPEQREKVRTYLEDRAEAAQAGSGPVAWLRDDSMRETLAQKLQSAGDKLGLTAEQQAEIRERVAGSTEKYRDQRRSRRELVESEFKAVADVLTPEQRDQARRFIEHRVLTATVAQSLSDRLQAAADKLGLTTDQRKRIVETCQAYEPKFESLADQRRELMHSELQAVSEILTPEQREKARDFCHDRAVVIEVQFDANDPRPFAQLRETMRERLETAADDLGLTAEQRARIKEKAADFTKKYGSQREQREALRKEELTAVSDILTPEQREKVKSYIADRVGAL